MSRYEVTFSVPVEVVVEIEADDEETAADDAWQIAEDTLQVAAAPHGTNGAIHGSLDGVGADKVRAL